VRHDPFRPPSEPKQLGAGHEEDTPPDRQVSLGAPGMWKHAADDWDRVRLKLDEAIATQARRRQ
jgi:hypothetical protein